MFFSFLVYKTLRAAVRLFFSNFFQSFFFWWKMYSKRFNFWYFLWIFFISSWFNATVMAYWKHLLYFFFDEIYCSFFVFAQSGKTIYDPPHLKFILRHLQYHEWTQSSMKSLPFNDFSNPIWYFLISDLKSSAVTSFASWLIMISMLSVFECITRPSSLPLEEIKLIAIFN